MADWRRDINRAFEHVYNELMKSNGWIFRKSKSFSKNCLARVTTANNTLQILECSNSYSGKKKCMCYSTPFVTHSDVVVSPSRRHFNSQHSQKINTNDVIDLTNLDIQHVWPMSKDSPEQHCATCASYGFAEKSNARDIETFQSYDCICQECSITCGEGCNNEDVCQKCHLLYHKVSKYESALTKDPSVMDHSHWSWNCWMMSNPVQRKSVSQKVKRDCRILLKYLRAKAQLEVLAEPAKSTTKLRKCSRPHAFLHRNLKLCKNARQHARKARVTDIENSRVKCSSEPSKMNNKRKRSQSLELESGIPANDTLDIILVEDAESQSLELESSIPANNMFNIILIEDDESVPVEDAESNVKLPKKKKIRSDKDTDETKCASCTSVAPLKVCISAHEKNTSSSDNEQNSVSKVQRPNTLKDSVSTDSLEEEHSGNSMFSCAVEWATKDTSQIEKDDNSRPLPRVGSGRFRELLAQMKSRPSCSVIQLY